ncbi:virion associated protein [Staphylococcus phage vB_StaM_PB50]|nr:virion associated protein [Staphylococcus phage vB_StaM_PB50]
MKIKRLKLKNFIGIYAGTGLKEIEIDFSKSKNNMIMLLGDNGSGKSAIISQLSPYRGSNDVRKNHIIEDEKGIKEIDYIKNSDIYEIKHHYGKNSSQNKSFIKKNGEELNENGGIKLFNEIVDKELDVSQEYFTVGRLGDNVSNFIDYTTGDRKTYINKFVPNIDKYLEAYKVANEKKRLIDKDLKSLRFDLDKYKEFDEIKKEKEVLENLINEIQDELDNANKEKTSNETKLNSIMEEKYNEIHPTQLKENLSNELHELEIELEKERKLKESNENLNNYTLESANEKKEKVSSILNEVHTNLTSTKKDKESNQDKLDDLISRKSKIESRMNAIKFNEDYDASQEIDEILQSYKDDLTDLDNDIDAARGSYFNNFNIKIKDDIEVNTLNLYIDNLLNKVNKFKSLVNDNKFKYNDIHGDFETEIKSNKEKISMNLNEANELNTSLNQIKGKSDLLKILEQKDHEHYKECVFVPLVVDFKDNEYDSIDKLETRVNELYEENNQLENDNELLSNHIDILNQFNYIKEDVDSLNEYLGFDIITMDNIKEIFINNSSFTNEENSLKSLSDNVNEIRTSERNRDELSKELERKRYAFKEDHSNQKLMNQYNEDKAELEKQIEEVKSNKDNILENLNELNAKKDKGQNTLDIINEFINLTEKSDEIKSNIKDKQYKIDEVDKDLNKLSRLYELNQQSDNKINSIKDNLTMKKNELESTKEKYFTVNTIINKIDDIEKVLWKYSLVVDSLNPKKDSIPLIFITNYLKDIAVSTNELLSVAYNNSFKIDFDLTDKDFFINVYKGNGTELQDIKEASQGETALTNISLSLSLLNKVSQDYNILYLDEMDATLDSNNRRRFVDVIDKQIELMGLEQVFLISHNDEFYSSDIDLILLKGYESKIDINDEEIMQGKNVLFKLN